MSRWIPDMLQLGLQRRPDAPCISDGTRDLSFAEVNRRSSRLAAGLQGIGISSGDRVALLTKNTVEFPEIQIACMRIGAVLVPLNFRLTTSEVATLIADSGARIIICSAEMQSLIRDLDCAQIVLGPAYESILDANPPCGPTHFRYDADDINAILYTSGTTGKAKGAVLTNGSVYSRMVTLALEVTILPGDTIVIPIPAFHAVSCCVYAWIMMGARVVLPERFDPVMVADLCEKMSATHLMVVPTMLRSIVDNPEAMRRDFTTLRMVLYGASSIAPAVLRRAMSAFQCEFVQTYGSTEVSPMTVLRIEDHSPTSPPHLLRSAGRDAIGSEVRITDEMGNDVPSGQIGEIVARGPVAAREYWQQPELSVTRGLGEWFKTGDAGYRDAQGYVYVLDRVDDIIITGAENVSSVEVESVLYDHPDVVEAAVVGIDDERWGQRIHAVIVPARSSLDPQELLAHCRSHLANYKVPKSIEFVEALPMNSLGKLLKREVRQRVNNSTGPNPGEASE
jgi:acyl-CoA synthetase (AMP-forming)/AMP-acid ligase II